MIRKKRKEKVRKSIELSNKGSSKSFSKIIHKQENKNEFSIPIESIYIKRDRMRFHSSVAFLGRFKFGLKEQLASLAESFLVPTTSYFSNTTGVLVVDDLNRNNSAVLKKARETGVLILSEEEFLYFLVSNKSKESELEYKEIGD